MSRRDERNEYQGDVWYDVWRRGGDPDRVDYDRVSDSFYDGMNSESAASREMRAQRPQPPQMDEEQYWQEQYPQEAEPVEMEPEPHAGKIIDESIAMVEKAEKRISADIRAGIES